jgi:hypothetical protein
MSWVGAEPPLSLAPSAVESVHTSLEPAQTSRMMSFISINATFWCDRTLFKVLKRPWWEGVLHPSGQGCGVCGKDTDLL